MNPQAHNQIENDKDVSVVNKNVISESSCEESCECLSQERCTTAEDRTFLMGAAVSSAGLVAISIKEFGDERQYNLYGMRQGHGRVAEDIAKESHQEWNYAPQEYKKNEPDLKTVDGQPIQVKACKTAAKTVNNLYEKQEFKYKDNIIAVPDEQVTEVKERLVKRGRTEDVQPIGASYEEICACKKRGLKSIKYDMAYASKKTSTQAVAITVGFSAGILFYKREKMAAQKENRKIKWGKVALKSIGCAALTFGVIVGGCGYKGYKNRPS